MKKGFEYYWARYALTLPLKLKTIPTVAIKSPMYAFVGKEMQKSTKIIALIAHTFLFKIDVISAKNVIVYPMAV